jgi:hypothetical protein
LFPFDFKVFMDKTLRDEVVGVFRAASTNTQPGDQRD